MQPTMLHSALKSSPLYLLSFASNFCILAFEIAGGRLLAPYLGTSVSVWAVLIAVVLGGMAIGYQAGGILADTYAKKNLIGYLLMISGAAALLSWSMRDVVPAWLASSGTAIPVTTFLIGTLLFVPTVVALAALSPVLAKKNITTLEGSAQAVGGLSAVGAIGSIAGAIVTGVYLIPYFGLDTILLGIALVLLLFACVSIRKNILIVAVLIAATGSASFFINGLPTKIDGLVADVSTAYYRIFIQRVHGPENKLALATDPYGFQCRMRINENGDPDETSLVDIHQKAHTVVVRSLFPEGPSRVLFLGGCALSYPRYLLSLYPDATANVVEIDPKMTEAARRYFGFSDEKFPTLSVRHEDARVFVNNSEAPQRYDVVVMDVWGSSGVVPFHLTSAEMFRQLSRIVSEDGVLVINTAGRYEGEGARYSSSYAKTAAQSFAHVALYQFTNRPHDAQNLVIVASQKRELPEQFTDSLFENLVLKKAPIRNDALVFTDNYSPIEGITNWDTLLKLRATFTN